MGRGSQRYLSQMVRYQRDRHLVCAILGFPRHSSAVRCTKIIRMPGGLWMISLSKAGFSRQLCLNAAPNNTNVLQIDPDPGGITPQDTYGFNGVDITAKVSSGGYFTPSSVTPPAGNVATYAVGTNSGWMYGDQPSATSSISASGNPVEAFPGVGVMAASRTTGKRRD